MTDRRLLITGLALLAAGLIGMSLQSPSGGWWGMHPGPMMGWWQTADSDTQPTPPVAGAPTIEVEATDFAFQPDRLTIEADKTINLTLVNQGRLVHDLSIPELNLHLVARPGETTATALTVTQPGEYQMLCTVPGHANAGMVGLVVVAGP